MGVLLWKGRQGLLVLHSSQSASHTVFIMGRSQESRYGQTQWYELNNAALSSSNIFLSPNKRKILMANKRFFFINILILSKALL